MTASNEEDAHTPKASSDTVPTSDIEVGKRFGQAKLKATAEVYVQAGLVGSAPDAFQG